MASALPAPFTEAFGFLIKGLGPLGLTARSINLESQSTNLDDAAISINLPGHKLNVRITYSGLEADARDVFAEDVVNILQVLTVVFDTLGKIDPELKKGTGTVRLSLHLKFVDSSVADYLADRVSANVNSENVTPEAVVFSLNIDEITKHFPTKITIAKSVAVENGLFLEIAYQSGTDAEESKVGEPLEFFKKIAEHYETVLSTLELSLVGEGEVA
ncbi:MAG: hypothetical protein ACRD6X_05485 [Pyrinomonadaceae bacterium]